MSLKRRVYKRTETVELVKVKYPTDGVETLFAQRRVIEGEKFVCTVVRADGIGTEMLFECDLYGQIEIEERASGEFTLKCGSSGGKLLPE